MSWSTKATVALFVATAALWTAFWPDPRARNLCMENFQRTGAKWWSMQDVSAVTTGPALMCSQVIDGPAWRYQRVYGLTARFPGPFVVLATRGGYSPW
jgi:hypothetical protein